jgi:hypothetical protein
VYVASSATAVVIIGPAGSDMQLLPPTVALFHTLNDARNTSQQMGNKAAAGQFRGGEVVQVPGCTGGANLQAVGGGHLAGPTQAGQVDQPA